MPRHTAFDHIGLRPRAVEVSIKIVGGRLRAQPIIQSEVYGGAKPPPHTGRPSRDPGRLFIQSRSIIPRDHVHHRDTENTKVQSEN